MVRLTVRDRNSQRTVKRQKHGMRKDFSRLDPAHLGANVAWPWPLCGRKGLAQRRTEIGLGIDVDNCWQEVGQGLPGACFSKTYEIAAQQGHWPAL